MTDQRRRSDGSQSDRKWWHDQRVLVTAIITSAPFVAAVLWQIFVWGGEWGALQNDMDAVKVAVADRSTHGGRIATLEARFGDIQDAIVDLKHGQEAILNVLMQPRRADNGEVPR